MIVAVRTRVNETKQNQMKLTPQAGFETKKESGIIINKSVSRIGKAFGVHLNTKIRSHQHADSNGKELAQIVEAVTHIPVANSYRCITRTRRYRKI